VRVTGLLYGPFAVFTPDGYGLQAEVIADLTPGG
jgi:hypothetical protein